MKPFCIPTHCPFCLHQLTNSRDRTDYNGIVYFLSCNQNCQSNYFDAISLGFEPNLFLIYLATPQLQISIYLNDPITIIQDHQNYNHTKQILSLNHIVWFDLQSKENILKKIKLLLTFS